jgi:hypothetical protein
MENKKTVSIITVNLNGKKLLADLLDSVRGLDKLGFLYSASMPIFFVRALTSPRAKLGRARNGATFF